jgi:hypothetical protein
MLDINKCLVRKIISHYLNKSGELVKQEYQADVKFFIIDQEYKEDAREYLFLLPRK